VRTKPGLERYRGHPDCGWHLSRAARSGDDSERFGGRPTFTCFTAPARSHCSTASSRSTSITSPPPVYAPRHVQRDVPVSARSEAWATAARVAPKSREEPRLSHPRRPTRHLGQRVGQKSRHVLMSSRAGDLRLAREVSCRKLPPSTVTLLERTTHEPTMATRTQPQRTLVVWASPKMVRPQTR
jgi:hypothetical protein